jgi:hypothetical protein
VTIPPVSLISINTENSTNPALQTRAQANTYLLQYIEHHKTAEHKTQNIPFNATEAKDTSKKYKYFFN